LARRALTLPACFTTVAVMARESPIARLVLGALAFYQSHFSKVIAEKANIRCVFEPSCSEYMRLAVIYRGPVRGVIAGLLRLSRCRAGHGGTDYPKGVPHGVPHRESRRVFQ
jgi:putative component of membrane protein insertase Oxa1/YidC/SpoIIIJ protein YidD